MGAQCCDNPVLALALSSGRAGKSEPVVDVEDRLLAIISKAEERIRKETAESMRLVVEEALNASKERQLQEITTLIQSNYITPIQNTQQMLLVEGATVKGFIDHLKGQNLVLSEEVASFKQAVESNASAVVNSNMDSQGKMDKILTMLTALTALTHDQEKTQH